MTDFELGILKVLSQSLNESADDWLIASTIHNFDQIDCRPKHGGWITAVNKACWRMEKQGLVHGWIMSHGLPQYNPPQSRLWCITDKGKDAIVRQQ